MQKIIFSDEQVNTMIDLYTNQNKSLKSLGEIFGVSRPVISRILKDNLDKITLRTKTTKYTANYNKFEVIDTAEKAYWLGFLAADGCVYTRENNATIILNLHQKDIGHIQKFKEFMQTTAEIIEYTSTGGYSNHTPMVKISLNSKKMAQDLIDKGITPRKSLTLNSPNIPPQFYLPYILGYFDGDGSISELSSGEYSLSFQGTKETLEWINEVLGTDMRLEKRYTNNKNSFYIRCGGNNKPYSILQKLYSSVPTATCLERKYLIYKNLEAVVLNRNVK